MLQMAKLNLRKSQRPMRGNNIKISILFMRHYLSSSGARIFYPHDLFVDVGILRTTLQLNCILDVLCYVQIVTAGVLLLVAGCIFTTINM